VGARKSLVYYNAVERRKRKERKYYDNNLNYL